MLHMESAILCHGFEPGVLADKLCIWDAQMSNTVYIPTPPYVMGLTLSAFPHHILTTHCLALYCNVTVYLMFVAYLHLDHSNVTCNCILHMRQADCSSHF